MKGQSVRPCLRAGNLFPRWWWWRRCVRACACEGLARLVIVPPIMRVGPCPVPSQLCQPARFSLSASIP